MITLASTGKIFELSKRAADLDTPHSVNAYFNIHDAINDLARWPHLSVQILADCEQAVALHEQDAREQEDQP